MPKKKALTVKQKLRCEEFMKTWNATQSYIKVYDVNEKQANVSWPRMLVNEGIMNYIKPRLKKRFENAEIDWQWVIDRLVEVVNKSMQKEKVMQYNPKTKDYEHKMIEIEDEKWEMVMVWAYVYDSAWATKALWMLAKYFKLYEDASSETNVHFNSINITIWKNEE